MISLRSKITQAVLDYFILHEGKADYVNEIARRLELDDGNLSRKLKELQQQGILKSENRGKELYYSLNSSFPLLKEYKKIIQKTFGLETTLKKKLKELDGIEEAFLFGSYAQDAMDLSSDIDLIVVGNHSTLKLGRIIAEIQKKVQREINVIAFGTNEYESKKKSDPFLKSVLRKKRIQLL